MSALLLPLSCALIAPVDFALFVTDASGRGTLRMCSVDSPDYTTHPLLTGIRLLACVPASRTPLDESYPGRALLRDDLEQGTRVQLPGGAGSVYHYERTDDASSRYGFFSVHADGLAHVLIELPATPGPSDPFLESVACRSDGASLLVATQPSAGGDLWELHVDGSPALNRTEGVPPQVFGRDSFFLSSSLAAAVTTTGVLRFDPQTSECAGFVGFGAESVPAWFGLELMPSANEAFVALVAGESQAVARPFVVGTSGAAACMNSGPAFLAGAGCLPEAQDGPWLAVSDDGALCAWRVGEAHTSGYAHELFLARRDAGGQALALHVTQDALFEPYIDEIGLAFFRPGGQLVFAGGDHGSSGALLSRADLFSATLASTGALQLQNLSLTSGDPAPPFLMYGGLEIFRLGLQPSSGQALVYSRDETGNRLLAIDFDQPGVQLIQDGVEGLGSLDNSGDAWVVGMDVPASEHATGMCVVESEDEAELDLLLDLPTFGGASRVLRNGNEPDWYACVHAEGLVEHLWQVNVSNGDSRLFSQRELSFGSSMAHTLDGTLILSIDLAGGASAFIVWPRDPELPWHRVWPVPQTGFVLPGA